MSVCEERESEDGGGEGRDPKGFVFREVDCRGRVYLSPRGNDNTPPLPNHESPR